MFFFVLLKRCCGHFEGLKIKRRKKALKINIYLFYLERRERDIQSSPIYWFTLQMPAVAGTGPERSRAPGMPASCTEPVFDACLQRPAT